MSACDVAGLYILYKTCLRYHPWGFMLWNDWPDGKTSADIILLVPAVQYSTSEGVASQPTDTGRKQAVIGASFQVTDSDLNSIYWSTASTFQMLPIKLPGCRSSVNVVCSSGPLTICISDTSCLLYPILDIFLSVEEMTLDSSILNSSQLKYLQLFHRLFFVYSRFLTLFTRLSFKISQSPYVGVS